MEGQIPWQFSQKLGHYIWYSSKDEIVFKDGRRIKRPGTITTEMLENARYNGPLPDFKYVDMANNNQQYENVAGSGALAGNQSQPRTIPGPLGFSAATGSSSSAATTSSSMPRPGAYASLPQTVASSSSRTTTSGGLQRSGQSSITEGLANLSVNPDAIDNALLQALTRVPNRPREMMARVSTNLGTAGMGHMSTVEVRESEIANGQTERLYPSYKKRDKKFFFVGKVFSILWSEPVGSVTQSNITSKEVAIIPGPFGEKIYSKIRRFVVIRSADNYCNALPILTYGGRGVGKKGVKKSEHTIVYTIDRPNQMLEERAGRTEEPMRTPPIRVDPDTLEERLDPKSRINLGHPHTIQHNVKVKSCGKVASTDIRTLQLQFASVMGLLSSSAGGGGQSVVGGSVGGSVRASVPRNLSSTAETVPTVQTADDIALATVRAGITSQLSQGVSRDQAVVNVLRSLQNNGHTLEAAKDLVRRAYSGS